MVGGIVRLAGLRVGGIAVRGLSGLRRVLQVVGLRACRRDCRSCRIVWLAGLRVGGIADAYCTSWDCLLAGLQAVGCRDCPRVGLRVAGGIAGRGIAGRGIACGGLCVRHRL